jgi:hypothetical protein
VAEILDSESNVQSGVPGLPVRVARSLWARWRRLATPDRERIEPLADVVRHQALDLRGSDDPERAGHDLGVATEQLADAMVDAAEADPQVSEADVHRLRNELARELDRVAHADITAYSGRAQLAPTTKPDGNMV